VVEAVDDADAERGPAEDLSSSLSMLFFSRTAQFRSAMYANRAWSSSSHVGLICYASAEREKGTYINASRSHCEGRNRDEAGSIDGDKERQRRFGTGDVDGVLESSAGCDR
jgi:hypothetical protein